MRKIKVLVVSFIGFDIVRRDDMTPESQEPIR